MESSLNPEDYQKWRSLFIELNNERTKEDLNPIFDSQPRILKEEEFYSWEDTERFGENLKYLPLHEQIFLGELNLLCRSIINTQVAAEKSGTLRIKDSLSSLSKILYLLDRGFELASGVYGLEFTDEQRKKVNNFFVNFNTAYSIVAQKRDAIFSYISPFEVELPPETQQTPN